jgi:anti-sigma-K factor RskA
VDLSCIISSGDLELYVLGSLPGEEAYRIEQLMSIFPEIREEVDRISETVEKITMQSEYSPGDNTRENIFNSFRQLKAGEEGQTPVKSMDIEHPVNTSITGTTRSINRYKYMAVAALVLLVASIGLLVATINENREKKKLISTLHQRVEVVNNNSKQQSGAYEQLLTILRDKDYEQIRLLPLPGKPQANVNVYWNPKTSVVYLLNISLPVAPPQKQYQLWAIVDGKPVSAGLLTDSHTTEKMSAFGAVQAFAITLEKAGGNKTPTLDQMYVMGKM